MTPPMVSPAPLPQRDRLGLSALVLGLVGVALGLVFGGQTWFVVIPAGLFAVILGVVAIGLNWRHLVASGKLAIVGSVAGCVALIMGASGTTMFLNGIAQMTHGGSGAVSSAVSYPPPPTAWGARLLLPSGLSVTATTPASFWPSNAASLPPGRPVSVTITVTNTGHGGYWVDSTDLGPEAAFAAPASTWQRPPTLIDLTLGIGVPTRGAVAPGRSVTYQVGYLLPNGPGDLRLSFASGADSTSGIICGPA